MKQVLRISIIACGAYSCGFPTLADDVLLGWYFLGAAFYQDIETGVGYSCRFEVPAGHIDSLFTRWNDRTTIEISMTQVEPEGLQAVAVAHAPVLGRGVRKLQGELVELRRTPDSLFLTNDILGTTVAVRDEGQYPQPAYAGVWQCPVGFPVAVSPLEPVSGRWFGYPTVGDPPSR